MVCIVFYLSDDRKCISDRYHKRSYKLAILISVSAVDYRRIQEREIDRNAGRNRPQTDGQDNGKISSIFLPDDIDDRIY